MAKVIDQLAEALRGCANYTYEDAENCWCAGSKCRDTLACVNARKALAAYARKMDRECYARDAVVKS